jgi:hypothetical protein
MEHVRAAAARLCAEGLVVARARGRVVDLASARGPVRLARAAASGRSSN